MGNVLCQFRTWLRRCRPRRGAPLGRHPLVLPSREAAPSDREHPAAPAPAICPGRRLSHRHRGPFSPALYIAPRRRSTRQARYKVLRVLIWVNCRDSPEKPVLAAFISMTFGHSRAIRIPPRRLQFTLLRSPPEPVVKVRKQVPSSHLPLPSPKEREVKVQEEPRRGMAKMEDHTETEGEDDRKRGHRSSGDIPLTSRPQEASGVLTSLKCNPEPLDLLPEHPEDNWSENAQVSPVSPSSESHVTCSDGDPGDVLPPWKPESHAMVLCVPAACRCPLLVRPKKEVLGEDHRPQSTGSPMSGKELQRETSSQIPARSSSSLASASSRPCKRKIPLTRDCADRPPSPKLPCLAAAKNPGTWLQRIFCPWSQNCLPETGLISGLPLIVPNLFSLWCHNRFYMGNVLCNLRTWLCQCWPRRGAPLGRHPLVLPSREAAPSDREHPAAPARAFCPGRRLSRRHRSPLSPALYIAPRRRGTRQARYKALRVLLLANWRDSPEKPVLAPFISMTFGHSRAIRIPPRRLQFTLLHSPPEPVVKVRKQVPSSHLPLPSPKEREVKVQEEPRRGMAKMEDHTETEGEDDRKRGHRSSGDIPLTSRPQEASGVLTSLKCNPEPLDLLPEHPEDNWSENAQVSPVSPSSESHVTCSDGDPGDVLPPWKPESHAMVLCVPAACRCPLLVRPKKEVLGEDHRPQSTGSPMSGKELQRETSSQIPARSSSSLASASSRPCKRKIPLTRDCADRPPSPKLPCLAAAKNPGTWLQRIFCPWSQNCLPETGLISGLPLIVPNLFSLWCHNRFYMGNVLCNLRTWLCQCWPRRGAPLGRHPLVLPSREAAPSDREHPAAPARAFCPGRRLSRRHRSPLSPALYIAPRRRGTRQARYKALRVLLLANWRDSPEKPVLAPFISMTFGHSRAIRIPPRRLQFTLLHSPPEPVVKVRKQVPSSHLPLPSPKEREVKVQEEPRRGMAKMEDHTETEGEDDRKRGHRSSGDIPLTSRPQEASGVLTSLKCNPEPLDLLPEHPEDNWSENAQVSPVSPSSESHVTCSDGDPGDVLPPWKPESHAMVLCVPAACRCPLLVRPKKEVLGEDHRPQSTGSPMSGKELQRETSSQIPARSSSSLASASSRPCKRKIPLTRDCGDELKRPCRRDNRWCESQILSRPAVAGGSCGSRSGAEGAEERRSVHSAEAVGVKSSRPSLGKAHRAGRATESCNAQGSHSSEGSRPRCRGAGSPSDHGPSAASGTLAADTMPTPACGPRLASRPCSVHSTRVAARRRRDTAPS